MVRLRLVLALAAALLWAGVAEQSLPAQDALTADIPAASTPPTPLLNPGGISGSFVDLDQFIVEGSNPEELYAVDEWQWQILPKGLIFESYLAGTKESRLSLGYVHDPKDDWLLDGTLGGRVGLFRYGDHHPVRPEGFQVDAEGAAQLRLDPHERMDFRSVDFRAGVPLTFGTGRSRWKFGYYHTSAHTGDEFLLKTPGFQRLNYSRDVIILGRAYYLTPRTRIYGEAGWAFYCDVCDPWEFQFGIENAPVAPTGPRGSPFWALNGHLRQELDFGGFFTAQAGWAWRSDTGSPLFRAGFHFLTGKSNQNSFYNQNEQQLGMMIWYDY